jgi:hypothetical protein
MTGERKREQRKEAAPLMCDAGNADRVVHDQLMWIEAVEEVRRRLAAHVKDSKPDRLRFVDGRLERALWDRVEAEAGEDRKRRIAMLFRCYSVITSYPLGYEEPVRLHAEEMKAFELGKSPRLFCRSFERRFALEEQATVEELLLRLSSIAAWMEVQESFSQWLAFKDNHAFWQGNALERRRAFQASILATWMRHLGIYEFEHKGRSVKGMRLREGLGIGTNDKGVPWTPRDWALILKQAAGIALKVSSNCTQVEQWVWWCYPVFWRYGWNAREVQAAARRRFIDKDSRRVIDRYVEDFRRYWMARGLRFFGKKTRRKNPPLWDFVALVRVPGLEVVHGLVTWRSVKSATVADSN